MGDGRLQCVWIVWVVSAWCLLQTYFECQELKDKPAPDFDERLTMNEIWKAGEGDGAPGGDEDGSWLEGGGLKFHTTADKAFSMAKQRFKEGATGWKPLQDFVDGFLEPEMICFPLFPHHVVS